MLDEQKSPGERTTFIDRAPTKEEINWVDEQLEAYNKGQTSQYDYKPLNLVIRDNSGSVLAGLKAITGWDWLYIDVLWVDENHRRKGFGTQLLNLAEGEAEERGCIGACLTSYSFQAPEFYQHLGYSSFGQIDDYPIGSAMFFLSKRF